MEKEKIYGLKNLYCQLFSLYSLSYFSLSHFFLFYC